MAWIESHTTLDKHHKVIRLRLAMRWSKNETIGFLHRFWWTVLEVSPSGDITALSSPEVMAEMLDMEPGVMAKVLQAMEHPDPKQTFLDRAGGRLLVHDWLDFAWTYLSDSKFKRHPEKLAEIKRIHKSADDPPSVRGQSSDGPRIVRDTNQTNQPDQPTARSERAHVEGFQPVARSEEAAAHAAAVKVSMRGQMTQAVMDRALEVLNLYPSKAKKDGRLVAKSINDQNALAYRIADNPGHPWEEHARLMQAVGTPPDLRKWVEGMPDPIALATLREGVAKTAPARNPAEFHMTYQPPEDDAL